MPVEKTTLSSSDRNRGQRFLRRFVTLNGISVAFLMNDLLILYGIRNGLDDPQVALLASFIHLSMPFMLFGMSWIRRVGAARTWGYGWLFRYLSGSVLILAPWIGRFAPETFVHLVILLGAFGFAVFRSIGLVANSPLIGEITTEGERGRFLSGNWVRANTTYFFSMALIIAIMYYFDTMWVYQLVIGAGCVIGIFASRVLVRVPETEGPARSASEPMGRALKEILSSPRLRRIIFAWGSSFAAFVLVIPFAVVTVKNGYGLSDYAALIFSLLVLAGGILSSAINAGVSDHSGPRPLLILYVTGLILVAGYWAFAPSRFAPIPTAAAFFTAGFCKTGIILTNSHYLLSAVEAGRRVSISLFARMAGGAMAGLAASVGGGTLLRILRETTFGNVSLNGIEVYHWYFRILVPVLLLLLLVVMRLERLKEWGVRRVISFVFSLQGLQTMLMPSQDSEKDGNEEDDSR
ncbi:MAG: MFS transporter [Spirochaetales bacterium]|nr:MFS transporter [Spirochaetales bacterium]MCF7937270.1 MFS transporter [Spirochaetales bacterium]